VIIRISLGDETAISTIKLRERRRNIRDFCLGTFEVKDFLELILSRTTMGFN